MNKAMPKGKTKPVQTDLFAKNSKSYGGTLLNKRKNRTYARPISTSQTMHIVLRSSKAVGDQSFKNPRHQKKIAGILSHFSLKYGIKLISLANVGTHLHLHVKIAKRAGYLRFIRAVTASIAMHVSGKNRWSVNAPQARRNSTDKKLLTEKFWDYRPFTRIIQGFRALLTIQDYIQINQLEGLGVSRLQARMMLTNVRPDRC